MVSPYYDDGQVTIYHADCADVLPHINPDDVGLLLTDPPYGIDYRPPKDGPWSAVHGDDEPFDPTPLLRFPRCVMWGGNFFCHRLPQNSEWIIWDKRLQDSTGSGLRVPDAEMAWTNVAGRTRIYRHLWAGPMRSPHEPFLHPTQKPVALMRWILDRWTEPDDLVLDPYMGSGPIAQACHELGRRYIGIELVEDYCKVAVGRLRQGVLRFDNEGEAVDPW